MTAAAVADPPMSLDSADAQVQAARAALCEALLKTLGLRMDPSYPLLLKLTGPALLSRSREAASFDPHAALAKPAGALPEWRQVGDVVRMFEMVVSEVPGLRLATAPDWAVMPYVTAAACRFAAELAGQMGDPAPTIDMGRRDPSIRQHYVACLRDAREAVRLTRGAGTQLWEEFRAAARGGEPEAAALVLLVRHDGMRAARFAADGRPLGVEVLPELCRRATAVAGEQLGRGGLGLAQRLEQHFARGQELLEAICPLAAQAVDEARRHQQCTVARLHYTTAPGFPVELCLYVDLRGSTPRASVAARRAHEEFILESASRRLFYFPPVQLVAHVDFQRPYGETDDVQWSVARPVVRQPAGALSWTHPYTNALSGERFSGARSTNGDDPPALFPVSETMRSLLGPSRWHPRPAPGERDMCLDGLDQDVSNLVSRFKESFREGQSPTAYDLIRGLWNGLRVGLTRGHQNNTGLPRVALDPDNMPYTLPDWFVPEKPLADRVFPFDPRRPRTWT